MLCLCGIISSSSTLVIAEWHIYIHDGVSKPPFSSSSSSSSIYIERKDGDPLPLLLEQGFESTEFRLLEAPSEVMEALEQGSRYERESAPFLDRYYYDWVSSHPSTFPTLTSLRIVGRSREEPAALVTDTATFEICRVETSNMLLLVPPLVEDKEKEEEGGVIGKVAYHYEVGRQVGGFDA